MRRWARACRARVRANAAERSQALLWFAVRERFPRVRRPERRRRQHLPALWRHQRPVLSGEPVRQRLLHSPPRHGADMHVRGRLVLGRQRRLVHGKWVVRGRRGCGGIGDRCCANSAGDEFCTAARATCEHLGGTSLWSLDAVPSASGAARLPPISPPGPAATLPLPARSRQAALTHARSRDAGQPTTSDPSPRTDRRPWFAAGTPERVFECGYYDPGVYGTPADRRTWPCMHDFA